MREYITCSNKVWQLRCFVKQQITEHKQPPCDLDYKLYGHGRGGGHADYFHRCTSKNLQFVALSLQHNSLTHTYTHTHVRSFHFSSHQQLGSRVRPPSLRPHLPHCSCPPPCSHMTAVTCTRGGTQSCSVSAAALPSQIGEPSHSPVSAAAGGWGRGGEASGEGVEGGGR